MRTYGATTQLCRAFMPIVDLHKATDKHIAGEPLVTFPTMPRLQASGFANDDPPPSKRSQSHSHEHLRRYVQDGFQEW